MGNMFDDLKNFFNPNNSSGDEKLFEDMVDEELLDEDVFDDSVLISACEKSSDREYRVGTF